MALPKKRLPSTKRIPKGEQSFILHVGNFPQKINEKNAFRVSMDNEACIDIPLYVLRTCNEFDESLVKNR